MRQMTIARTPRTIAPPTPTTTPMIIFLSEEDRPLLLPEDELSALRPAVLVAAAGVDVVVTTLAKVLPLMVSYEVMVSTTGVWVVEVVAAEVVFFWSSEEEVDVVLVLSSGLVVLAVCAAVVWAASDVVEVVEVVVVGSSLVEDEVEVVDVEVEEVSEVVVGVSDVVVASAEVVVAAASEAVAESLLPTMSETRLLESRFWT